MRPQLSALLGYSENELRALNFAELVHPEDRETNLIEFGRLVAEEIPSYEVVNRYVGKVRGPLWVQQVVCGSRHSIIVIKVNGLSLKSECTRKPCRLL